MDGNIFDIEKVSAVITDLDETLWGGTLAEKQNILLNKEYYEFLKFLYKKGILIFVVSKNDEDDVHKVFKELKIDEKIFTEIIANWEPKYLNIEKLIAVAQLRPETVIFVDDNLLERNEVQTKLKNIFVVDARDWRDICEIRFLKNKKEQSEVEIAERVNRYRTAINSAKVSRNISEDPKFLKALERKLSIRQISPDYLDRFVQLLVTTHRINFHPYKFEDYDATYRYLYKKINEGYKLYAVSVFEQGFPLGLSGAIVVNIEKAQATIEDGTFSCGIIGRDFEQRALISLVGILKKQDVRELFAKVKLTSTNVRVREIFDELGFVLKNKDKEEATYYVRLDSFRPKKLYEWIEVLDESCLFAYYGISSVMNFFDKYVLPLFERNSKIINLGSAKGEVIGLLQENRKKEFYRMIKERQINFTKIDIEKVSGEENVVANAEDLSEVIEDESQDLVLAIELLEHTEHFWKVVDEMARICKIKGHIFISVPSFDYPKHEYPIDLWRIGPQTLQSFFPKEYFEIVEFEIEGDRKFPRRCMILVKKIKSNDRVYELPKNGKINWKNGLTIFP